MVQILEKVFMKRQKKDLELYKIENSKKFIDALISYAKKYNLPLVKDKKGSQEVIYSFFNPDHDNFGCYVNKVGDLSTTYFSFHDKPYEILYFRKDTSKEDFDKMLSQAYTCLKYVPKPDADFISSWKDKVKEHGEIIVNP